MGNMEDWWTEEDGKEYEKRVDVMVEQANKVCLLLLCQGWFVFAYLSLTFLSLTV